ncbi:MAG: bifunctional demethylmenaquinone methyltransferase/2-methoxy-6-polyprenyl-1,4-benzoquinol methylase UbiE [Spirochaetes bacterium]|nr:bifunctional demethylmenaquinone methyltransferase/2-methoxy-6-polyprenyl-1,4-benzoquinol methylase UbiE [Spirochaetota bacterium]
MKSLLSYELNNDNPENKKRFIKNLFDDIVPTYDLLNHLLSFGTDKLWRRRIFRLMRPVKDARALDLCCGTGDLSLLIHRHGAGVVSLDFSLNMLAKGKQRKTLRGYCVAADASNLPFRDSSFNAAAIAFGIRNIPDLKNFIRDVHRVLEPGGEFAILELVRPRSRFIKAVYAVYLNKLLPLIGGLVSGKWTAYKYLSGTIRTFVDPDDLKLMLEQGGFRNVKLHPQTFGVASIIVCEKA